MRQRLASELGIALETSIDPMTVVAKGADFMAQTIRDLAAEHGVPLLEGKGLVDGQPAVYVCERFTCHAPVVEAADPDLTPAR